MTTVEPTTDNRLEREACIVEANRRLLDALHRLSSASDLEEGLGGIADLLSEITPYDNLGVLLLDELGRELRFALAVGYPEGVARHWRFGLGQGLIGHVAETGEPLLCSETADEPRYLDAAPGTRSEVAVPLRFRDRVIGVLDLGRRTPHGFDQSHLETLLPLADCIAGVIENRRMYESTQAQARILSLLHELSRELTSILDRRELLEKVAQRLEPLLNYDVFTVFLWSEDDRRLEPWVSQRSGAPATPTYGPLTLGEGITGTVAALRQPLRVANVLHDPRHIACDASRKIRSELAVPMVFEDRLLGVLDFESTRFNAFSLEHELLVSTLASSLAIALVNAETLERLDERRRELDRDLRTARRVQQQLLPDSTPWIPGIQIAVLNRPARRLGGDFYDFVRYDEGEVGVAIGDVAGKGTSAALYGALAVGAFRELATHVCPCPDVLLERLNHRLRQFEVRRRFVALAFAVLEPERRCLRFANAGLPYPLLLRDGKARELQIGGVPLGIMPGATHDLEELELEAGDLVVFHTDGLSEARNSSEEELGSGPLLRALEGSAGRSADEIAAALLEVERSFSADDEPADDRTVVVVRVT